MPRFGIEPGRRFVEEQHLGIADDPKGDIDTAALSPGKLPKLPPSLPDQADLGDHLLRITRTRVVPGEMPDNLPNRKFEQIIRGLRDDPQPGPKPPVGPSGIGPEHGYGAAIARKLSRENLHGSGLAGPIGPQDRKGLTPKNLKIKPGDCGSGPIHFAQTTHADN